MLNFTKILLLFFALVVLSTRTCVQDTSTSEVEDIIIPIEMKTNQLTSDEPSFEKCSAITRGVLITHCGSCHQSSLESHKIGAIQIFDLDMGANWHTSLSEEHLQGIAGRIKNKSAVTQKQKEAIDVFLQLKESQLKN
ncbi:hypothetical protein [Aquimarina sp. MMG016]|uniref:hypothetical protein n=1 Tax=Aquimarina sp. MMG016 TaxID=2822690 RepID=UPI001B3A4529|nr:hypothetical protein [Aquimarina sp. MMG016]MBQ4819308.1 hypothetical protein [Aquimarina sp. MMG016]